MVRDTILLDFQNLPSADGIRKSNYHVQCLATQAFQNLRFIYFPAHVMPGPRHETNTATLPLFT